MKKLLIIALLFIGMMGFAQKAQIVEDYYQCMTISPTNIKSEWVELKSRFIFNYSGNDEIVKVFVGNQVFEFKQQGLTEKGETESGITYQLMNMFNIETFDELSIQVFDDQRYGVRILFDDNSMIQFVK
jgi:hypothetical protein